MAKVNHAIITGKLKGSKRFIPLATSAKQAAKNKILKNLRVQSAIRKSLGEREREALKQAIIEALSGV